MLQTQQPQKTLRVETLRPWLKVDRVMEGDQVIDLKRREVKSGEIVTVDYGLGRELCANGKAVLAQDNVAARNNRATQGQSRAAE